MVGLPIAVSLGWSLATPARPPAHAAMPGGAGVIGAAPARENAEGPDSPMRYTTSTRSPAAQVSSSVAPPPAPPRTGGVRPATAPTAPPSATPSASTPPDLSLPPVPTPTDPGDYTDPDETTDPAESGPIFTPPSDAPDAGEEAGRWFWWTNRRGRG